MPRRPSFQRLDLAADGLVRLDDACGTRVRCEAGTLWLTIDGQLDDLVLEPGESLLLRTRARVIVQALGGSARVAMRTGLAPADCRGSLAQRLVRALRGLVSAPLSGAA